jgi:hypothetical protein
MGKTEIIRVALEEGGPEVTFRVGLPRVISDFGLPCLPDKNYNVGECGEPRRGWRVCVLPAAGQEVLDWGT